MDSGIPCLRSETCPEYAWRKTIAVQVGDVSVGSGFPVRIQSMTSLSALDIAGTVTQINRLVKAGCEMVRIAVPGMRETEALRIIKKEIRKRGISVPLIADVHFSPSVAEAAAEIVEKVRINPGNYYGRLQGKENSKEISDEEVRDIIRGNLTPLAAICRKNGVAIRVGSNHGSLAPRILQRYGNTAEGMVEATLEFVYLFEEIGFTNLVLAMKASSVPTMIRANHLLVKRMAEEGMGYPLHLGVTEAGDGQDGRVKSAAGTGSLLFQGIGDTIRVSLTEDPEKEIPVARHIVSPINFLRAAPNKEITLSFLNLTGDSPDNSTALSLLSASRSPVVIAAEDTKKASVRPDYVLESAPALANGKPLQQLHNTMTGKKVPVQSLQENIQEGINLVMLDSVSPCALPVFRARLRQYRSNHPDIPVIVRRRYAEMSEEETVITAAMEFGLLLSEKLAEGLLIETDSAAGYHNTALAPDILQGMGLRRYKTEFIACPSCGRTTFDIRKALRIVKDKTEHLAGLKIAVMGCIVNGPGEMADADYGYVGSGKGKVTLFRRNLIVKKNISEELALDELVSLIKRSGDWKEKPEE